MRSLRRYCLITPCRDEAKYARQTLDAVARQAEPPALWVIVDDGSKDDTPRILDEYARRLPYIRIVRRPDRGVRKLGGGVIDAFYAGYDTIDPDNFEYICKLDLDLDLPPRYLRHSDGPDGSQTAHRHLLGQAILRPVEHLEQRSAVPDH